jgi:predicted DNA-binding WGR domain protein
VVSAPADPDPPPPLPPPRSPITPKPESEPLPEPKVSIPGSASAPIVRYFEFIGGSSRKFWEVAVQGNSFTVRFGRIGTAGQSQTKTFADEAKAKREAEGLIAEKLKKGYTETARKSGS